MKASRFRRVPALLPALLLIVLLILPARAAGGVGQVNLHLGQSYDTVNLTYTAQQDGQNAVVVTSADGRGEAFAAAAVYSESAGKYLYTAELTGLSAGTAYTYDIASGAYCGTFTTARTAGAFTFAFVTDPQIGFASDARATGAAFAQLNQQPELAFAFIAGDLTDSPRNETQWELLFQNGGAYAGAGQLFLGNHLLAAAQGNHDNSTFSGHITAPSAGAEVGNVCYAFDYSNAKIIILNLNSPTTWDAQAAFLRAKAAEAKTAGQWIIVGFHQSIYSGSAHITNSGIVAARKRWGPLLSEVGADVVLQGHDHVYARGFVNARGANASPAVIRNAYQAQAPLYLTGGEFGAVKWYGAQNYKVSAGDPLAPGYRFLDVNSAVSAQNPWKSVSNRTKEQTYTLIHVDGDEMRFETYMFKYDGKRNQMTVQPYLYDSLILRRGSAAQADCAVLQALDDAVSPGSAPAAAAFSDVPPESWYADAVHAVVGRGLLQGAAEGRFAPLQPLTRREVVLALYRLAGEPAVFSGQSFSDVPAAAAYAGAVAWAAERGIVTGNGDGTFSPDGTVTRAQLAAFFYRMQRAAAAGIPAGSGTGTYADWRTVPRWAQEALSWSIDAGLLRGKTGNLLAPDAPVNRAEGAVFLARFCRLYGAVAS